jgi:hypothetical protein
MKMPRIIRNLFYRIFTTRIGYKKLYSTVWNKEKSDYLRKKIKGKKTINWHEKRGKGSYFDRELKHFIEVHTLNKFDDDTPNKTNTMNQK